MLRIALISTQLHALVGDDIHEHGAHTALILCDRSGELYGYACKASEGTEPWPHAGLMAPPAHAPPSAEERARMLAAIAITAWRKNAKQVRRATTMPVPERPVPASASAAITASVRNSRTQRRLSTSRPRDASSHSSHSARERRPSSERPGLPRASMRRALRDMEGAVSEDQSVSGAETESESCDTNTPMFVECEHGRLLIVRIHAHAITEQHERCRQTRLSRRPLRSRMRSRHPSFANSTSSGPGVGDVSATHHAVANLRAQTFAEESLDMGFSTEDETDVDSASGPDGLKGDLLAQSLLLVLHAPSTGASSATWDTLVRQAVVFADANAHAPSRPFARTPAESA